MDDHVVGIGRECSKVVEVSAQYSAAGFSHRNDDGVDRGSLAGLCSQGASSTSEMLRQPFDDVARLQESIDQCVGALTPGERLDEDDRGDDRWPNAVSLQHRDQRRNVFALTRKASDPA